MKPNHTIDAIVDALDSRQRQGETSLVVSLEPGLIQDAIGALQGYRKLFAPVIPGLTDTVPIYAVYERLRRIDLTQSAILLLVECQTIGEFREALARLPARKSSEWRSLDHAEYWELYSHGGNDSSVC